MNQTQIVQPTPKGRQNQQRPKMVFKLLNPFMKLILHSPLRGRISERVMVLSFTGRRSGKRYSTPVAYVREGDTVIVVTYSSWRNNFTQPTPVQMYIQGKSINGTALFVEDPARIKPLLHILMAASGKEMMQRMGLWIDDLDAASPEAVKQATEGAYFIEIHTKDGQ
jgi:hypothetical protein